MSIIKPSVAFKAGDDWVSAEVRAYMKDQTPIHVDTVADVNDSDFEQARWLYVKFKNSFYRLNLSSTAEDDGHYVLRDNMGRRYEKIGSPGTVEAVVSPDGSILYAVAMTQAEYDELDPVPEKTLVVING